MNRHKWQGHMRSSNGSRFPSVHDIQGGESGSVLPLIVLMMVALFTIVSFVLNVGAFYVQRQHMQSATDFGALAGAGDLLQGAGPAQQEAVNIANTNDATAAYQVTVNTSANTVTVVGEKSVPLWIAYFLGIATAKLHTAATAELGTLIGGTGMVPIGVPDQTFSFGQEVYLSNGAGNGQSGNYGFLDFSGQGANGVEYDIEHGFDFLLFVGEQVATKPGVMAGPVQNAINYRLAEAALHPDCSTYQTAKSDCPLVLYLPVVNTLDVSGKKDVTIVGFAAFYLEGLVGNGGHQQILGRFIQMVRPGEIGNSQNYGIFSVKLIQ